MAELAEAGSHDNDRPGSLVTSLESGFRHPRARRRPRRLRDHGDAVRLRRVHPARGLAGVAAPDDAGAALADRARSMTGGRSLRAPPSSDRDAATLAQCPSSLSSTSLARTGLSREAIG